MMKILFLLTQDLESPSGLGRYLPLAKELTRLGHQICISALHPSIDEINHVHQVIDGIHVEYIAPMHVLKRGNHKHYYTNWRLVKVILKATFQLSRSALGSEVDIVHVAKPHPMNSTAGLLAKYLRGKQFFLDCDDYEAASGRFLAKWQKWGISWFEKSVPHTASIITTNTLFMKKKLVSWGISPKKIYYLPNGVDRERFSQLDPSKIEALRNSLRINDRKVILFLGSLSLPSHSVDLLIKAFGQIRIRMPESLLMLVGGGEDYQNLVNQTRKLGISDSVIFTGRVSPADVPLYYHLSDVSVDPVYDNDAARGRSPLKLFESWACGTPFVTADVGDRANLIGSPPAGIVTKPGDPTSLVNAILQILHSPELAQIIRNRGYERVESYYWDNLVQKWDTVYSQHNPAMT